METQFHSTHSSHREKLIEHVFVGEVLRELWRQKICEAEVLTPQVDEAGYDLVMECRGVMRHIQLKASHSKAKTGRVTVNLRLKTKPSGCVVWIIFDDDTMELGPFRWFGNRPGVSLPSLDKFKVAKHVKGDATGKKNERPNHRVVPKAEFEELSTIGDLVTKLFGPAYLECSSLGPFPSGQWHDAIPDLRIASKSPSS